MQKSDLTSTITDPHCKMDVGRGGVLGILKCLLQNGCTTGAYTLLVLPRVGYSPTPGVSGVWDRAGLRRAGAPTPSVAGVQARVLHTQMRKGVCDPHSQGRGVINMHTRVCVCGTLGSITESDLLPLVTGIVVICCMAGIDPEYIVQWLSVHSVSLINQYTTSTLIWLKLCELIRICYRV